MAQYRHIIDIILIVAFALAVKNMPSQLNFQKSYVSYLKATEDGHEFHNSSESEAKPPSKQPTTPENVNASIATPPSAPPMSPPTSNETKPYKPVQEEPKTFEGTRFQVEPPPTLNETKPLLPWSRDAYKAVQEEPKTFEGTRFQVEEAEGRINEKGQLVVDLDAFSIHCCSDFRKICAILRNMTLVESLDETETTDVPSTLLNTTMDCNYREKGRGQGNYITAIYQSRIVAFHAGVDFRFQCNDGRMSQMKKLLPWFDQYIAASRSNRKSWPWGGERLNEKAVCSPKYPYLRVDRMTYQIQDDLRKMAVTLLGSVDEIRRHKDVPIDAEPLIPDVQLDDVAIHFRCGDVLGGARRYDFGMIRFNEYKKWIPNNTESIGIMTQPFEKELNRGVDGGRAEECRKVVYSLVEYLQDFAPSATISIHNGPNETLPLTYARIVMANYSFTSLSSFGIFPVVGTFGKGYFQQGNRGVNPFSKYIPGMLPNIHEMKADKLTTGEMVGKEAEDLIPWFINDTATWPLGS